MKSPQHPHNSQGSCNTNEITIFLMELNPIKSSFSAGETPTTGGQRFGLRKNMDDHAIPYSNPQK